MRNLLCNKCLNKHLPAGVRQIYARTDFEPAEYQRLVVGKAAQPAEIQRIIYVNGKAKRMATDYYNCDNCGTEIRPSETCGCWSVWREDQNPEPQWEHDYLSITSPSR